MCTKNVWREDRRRKQADAWTMLPAGHHHAYRWNWWNHQSHIHSPAKLRGKALVGAMVKAIVKPTEHAVLPKRRNRRREQLPDNLNIRYGIGNKVKCLQIEIAIILGGLKQTFFISGLDVAGIHWRRWHLDVVKGWSRIQKLRHYDWHFQFEVHLFRITAADVRYVSIDLWISKVNRSSCRYDRTSEQHEQHRSLFIKEKMLIIHGCLFELGLVTRSQTHQ